MIVIICIKRKKKTDSANETKTTVKKMNFSYLLI